MHSHHLQVHLQATIPAGSILPPALGVLTPLGLISLPETRPALSSSFCRILDLRLRAVAEKKVPILIWRKEEEQ